ncbi:UNVERIFIED_CONTAM: hypothetical protein PYX00_000191 [Menopon gallinae]|uniref:Cytochrome P450 n=1 Tax=Menopon gallinae TaxID=328185 RepID=A0AAW2I931_9NEOP
MIALILICVVLLLFQWSIKRPRNFPPGPPSIPILGSVPFLELNNFHLSAEKLRDKYGPVIGLRFGNRNAIIVCGAREVEETLRRDEFQGRPQFTVTGKGVMFSDGEFWIHQRRFTLRHLRDFGFGKNSMEDVVLGEVDDFFHSYFENCNTVQVSGLFNTSVINVLWAMMGGKRYPHDDQEFRLLLDCLQKRFRNGTVAGSFKNRHPFLSKLLPFLKQVKEENVIDELIRNFLMKAFKEHKLTKEGEPRDFIDVYLNELDSSKSLHSSFSEQTLLNVCTEFFSAGAESVGNSLGFNLLYCVLYPEWQEQLYDEITSVIGKNKPSLSDKKSLHKVEAFMTEVSRCNTIASFTVPHRCLTETTLNGYTIPKDCMVLISLYATLQDKKHWGDPENFRPSRFLDTQGTFVKHKEGLPVFGAGKRVCPGESLARNTLFLFFTSMIQHYKFVIPDDHPRPSTIPLSGFTQAPQPFEVTVTRRS